jgi:hypothetical protein
MRALTTTCVLALVLCAATEDAFAQSGRPAVAHTVSPGLHEFHGMETVSRDGARTALSPATQFKLDREVPRSGESLVDVTRRKGYEVDPGTMEAVRKLNPNLQSTVKPLRPGEAVTFVRPVENLDPDARIAVVPGVRSLAPLVFQSHRADIASARTEVQRSFGLNQLSVQQLQSLQAATSRLDNANAVFETRAATMSPRQRALAALQIEAGTAQIRSAIVSTSGDPLGAFQASVALAADADAFSKHFASGPRRLKVVVRPSSPGTTARPLAVYVLPLGLVRYGPSTDESKLRNLIDALAFTQPTSPSLGEVEAGLRYAVWLGPRHSVELMARMIKNGATPKYISVDATPASLADVIFNESDQVRAP